MPMHFLLLAPALALGVQLVACTGDRPDPDRARCQQQLNDYYRLTEAPDFLERGFGDRSLDPIVALAAQVAASRDSYCGLVRDKAVEVVRQRAEIARTHAEAQAAVVDVRTAAHVLPVVDSGAASEVPADGAGGFDADAAVSTEAGGAAKSARSGQTWTTYCQWSKQEDLKRTTKWFCTQKPPAESKLICEERLRAEGFTNVSCTCSDDPSYVAGKCR